MQYFTEWPPEPAAYTQSKQGAASRVQVYARKVSRDLQTGDLRASDFSHPSGVTGWRILKLPVMRGRVGKVERYDWSIEAILGTDGRLLLRTIEANYIVTPSYTALDSTSRDEVREMQPDEYKMWDVKYGERKNPDGRQSSWNPVGYRFDKYTLGLSLALKRLYLNP